MSIAVIEKQGTTLTVSPEGRLDTVRSSQLDKELQPHLEGVTHLVMDFSKVVYVSSSCLRLLLWLEQEMETRGGEVRVTHVSNTVLNVFSLAGFTTVINVIGD